jgi:RHS repeat-associated protein
MSGFGYDNSGNVTSDPYASVIGYDAENHQTTYGASTYSYDGDGRWVKKQVGSTTTVFVYNVAVQLIAEYDNSSSPPPGSGTSYLISDHLGSTRAVIKADGTVARHDYLPFGEEIPSSVGSRSSVVGYSAADDTRQKFTEKERDSESGLDYFGARYYSSAVGRFTSVDPITVTFARMVDPQQMSLYTYARNNPLVFVDPTGMIIDTSRLSEDDLKKWQRVVAIANATDEHGNYTNTTLHAEYERLESDTEHTFFIENQNSGEKSGEAGRFTITKFRGDGDFSEATIRLDFKKIKNMESSSNADLVPGFKKFEGLFGVKNEQALRLAELFGHEAAHAVFALDHGAESVALERLTSERDAMIAALPMKHRYPLPPDIQEKVARADRDLVPTERYAQQQEKIINGELRASQRKRK